jgi:hypothetical protein
MTSVFQLREYLAAVLPFSRQSVRSALNMAPLGRKILAVLCCFAGALWTPEFVRAADVVATLGGPTSGTFTLTVKNLGSTALDGVSVSVLEEDDPNEVLVFKTPTPAGVGIEGGESWPFEIGFDAVCPSEPRDEETIKLRFEVNTTTPSPLYFKNCGFSSSSCSELEAEIVVDERACSQVKVEIAGVIDGATYSNSVGATINVADALPLLSSFSGSFGDIDGNFSRTYTEPIGVDSASHAYGKHCEDRSYSIFGSAIDTMGYTDTALLSFSIKGIDCPRCYQCKESDSKATCFMPPGAGCDPPYWIPPNPDDNVDLATNPPVTITSLASYDRFSSIGVLRNGYSTEMFRLLASFGGKAALVGVGFDPSIIAQIRVLVIPSGGLSGLENSGLFKAALAEYVTRGGIIVSMSQPNGRELSALPGSPGGYGWLQDTACFSKSFYIEQYHQFLSGQHIDEGTSDAEVDGYFTDLPLFSKVYLRRTRNGQPGLVEYPYGFAGGRVIATTAYADWAFANGQAASDSRHLVRDILAWAIDPKELAEYVPAETVSVLPIQVFNIGHDASGNPVSTIAEKVRLTILTPDRKTYMERVIEARVEPDTLIEVDLVDLVLPAQTADSVGIWWVDFTLLDAAGNTVQQPQRWNRFVVSPANYSPYQQDDLYFSIQSDSDYYPEGGRAEFTYIAFNTTDTDQIVAINGTSFPSMMFSTSILVPAYGQNQIVRIMDPVEWRNGQVGRWGTYGGGGWVVADFIPPDGLRRSKSKQFLVYRPNVVLGISGDKPVYSRGETAHVNLVMRNAGRTAEPINVSFELHDPSGALILEQSFVLDAGESSSRSELLDVTFPADVSWGMCTGRLTAIDARGNTLSRVSKTFSLPEPLLSVSPVWPSVFTSNSVVGLIVHNTGEVPVRVPGLSAKLTSPSGSDVWTESRTLETVAPGESRYLELLVSIPEIVFGAYQLSISHTFESKQAEMRRTITSALIPKLAIHQTAYRLNTSVPLAATITNKGDFRQDFDYHARIADGGFEHSESVTLDPGKVHTSNLTTVIPPNLASGLHQAILEVELASGSKVATEKHFEVAQQYCGLNIRLNDLQHPYAIYRIREEINPYVYVRSGGFFEGSLEVGYLIEIPVLGYSHAETLHFVPGKQISFPSADFPAHGPVSIPDTLEAGSYPVIVTLTFPSGETQDASATFTVPASNLVLREAGSFFAAGSEAHASLQNEGGVDTNYECTLQVWDAQQLLLQEASLSGALLAGAATDLSVPVPAGAENGKYLLVGNCSDLITTKTSTYNASVNIGGAAASLSVTPDKPEYLAPDTKEALVSMGNLSYLAHPVEGASLRLRVYATGEYVCEDVVCGEPEPMAAMRLAAMSRFDSQLPVVGPINPTDGYLTVNAPDGLSDDRVFTVEAVVSHDDSMDNPWVEIVLPAGMELADPGDTAVKVIGPVEVGQTGSTSWRVRVTDAAGGGRLCYSVYYSRGEGGDTVYKSICVPPPAGVAVMGHAIWETTIATDFVDAVESSTQFDIGTATGKFYLEGILSSQTTQVLATTLQEFYVFDSDLPVRISADRRYYKPGETVSISGVINNRTVVDAEELSLLITADGAVVYSEPLLLAAGQDHPYAFTIAAANPGRVILTASLSLNGASLSSVSDRIEVVAPEAVVSVEAPSVVGAVSFDIRVTVSNESEVPSSLTIALARQGSAVDEAQAIEVPPQGTRVVTFNRSIDADTTFVVAVSGDISETREVPVAFGLAALAGLYPDQYNAEGQVSVWYDVENVGLLPGNFPVEFKLYDAAGHLMATENRSHYLLTGEGGYAEGVLQFDLVEGSYRLTYQTIGDAAEVTFQVVRALGIISLSPSLAYPEGNLQVPYRIENLGFVAGWFEVGFELYREAELIESSSITQFLNSPDDDPADLSYVGSFAEGELSYQLAPGTYTVRSTLNQEAAGTVSLVVLPLSATSMTVSLDPAVNGILPVHVLFSNAGFESFSGRIIAETDFWSGEAEIGPILPGGEANFSFSVDFLAAQPGQQAMQIRLFDRSGAVIHSESAAFVVHGPQLALLSRPDGVNVPAGDSATLTYCVRNAGDQEGFLSLRLAAFDGSESRSALLDRGGEACYTFTVPIPEDLEEKSYDASYTLSALIGGQEILVEEGRTAIHVQGVKVDIVATLDKKLYRVGDTAHLTLEVSSTGSLVDVPLLARINYGVHEEYRAFTLGAGGNQLAFDVPITSFESRLLYEVLMETGRSIYINTLFVQEKYDTVWLSTDNTAYSPGEQVVVTVEAAGAGLVQISALYGGFEQELLLEPNSPVTSTFTLPPDLYGGTQLISYSFGGETHTYNFNVDSPTIEFIDSRLDKSRYSNHEPFRADFQVLSGAEMDGWVDGYVEDPEGVLIPVFSYQGHFIAGVNDFSVSGLVMTGQTGMHKLYCLLYRDADRTEVLTTVGEAFDVGSFAITQVLTDRERYREGIDPVVMTAYLAGEAFGSVTVSLDGQELFTQPVFLIGFNQLSLTIPAASIAGPGAHRASVRLFAGAEESTREVTFDVRKRPNAPVFDVLPEVTNLTALNLSGTVDPFVRVDLWVNDVEAGSVFAGSEGRFAFALVPLPLEGQNRLEATAVDEDGTASGHTTNVVERDTIIPVVAISAPQAGFISTSTPVLTFATSEGVVSVLIDGQPAAVSSGDTIGPFPDGEHQVLIEATDLAGNTGSDVVAFAVQTAVPTEVVITVANTAGRAISGVPVYAFTGAGTYTGKRVVTGSDGKAAFPASDFPGGTFKFRADYLGYQFWSGTLTIPGEAGGSILIAEEVTTVTVVQGSIPKGGIRVYLYTGSGTYLSLSEVSDAGGAVSFTLPAGKDYKFRADFLGTQYYSPIATVAIGGPNTYLVDVGGGVLTANVDQGNGQPIVGATTYLFSAAGSYLNLSKLTDSAGKATYSVSGGSYKIRCDYLGYQFWSDSVAVSADTNVTLSIPLHATTLTVAGSYAGSTEPRENVPVYLFTEAGTYLNKMLKTGADGRVSFLLPERGYKARVDYLSFQFWSAPLSGPDVAMTIPEGVAEVAVTDSAGPLTNVSVYVLNKNGSYLNLTKKTAANGNASFRLPAETYKFRADYMGTQFFSSNTPLLTDQVNPVTIATGGGTFTLTLQSDGGRPLSGVACYLFNAAGSYLNVSRVSGDQGQALFDLANGTYKFRVDHRGYQFWTYPVTLPGAGSILFRIPEKEVTVTTLRGGGIQSGVPVYLFTQAGSYLNISASTDVVGHAQYDLPIGKSYKFRADFLGSQYWSDAVTVSGSTNGVTIDMGGGALALAVDRGDGTPLVGAKTYLFSAGGSYLGLSGQTDVEGRSVFDVSTGSYKVRCDYLGYQFWTAAVTVTADTVLPLSIPHRDVTVSVAGDFGGAIEPRAELPVYLFTTAGSYLNVFRRTDASGQTTISLPERDYKVRVDDLSYRFWSDTIRGVSAIVIIPEALAEVTVVRGLAPLAGAPVYVFNASGQYLDVHAVSDERGAALFRLPAETFLFRADDLGDQFFSTPVELAAHQVNPVTVSLGGGNFALHLANGATPLPGVACYLFDENGSYLNVSRVTDATGRAAFDLANGTYRIRVDFLGHQFWSELIYVPNQMDVSIALPLLEIGITVRGDYGGDIRLLESIPLYLFNEAGTYLGHRHESDEFGVTSFLVPERPYKVRADYLGSPFWSDIFTWAPQVITILEGVAEVDITQAGAPLVGASVYAFSDEGAYLGLSERSDGAGKALFRLPQGAYRFAADVQRSRFFGSGTVNAGVVNPIALATGGGQFDLTVRSSDGRLLSDLPVFVYTPARAYIGVQSKTDAMGSATFTLSDGEYLFRLDSLGYQFWTPPHVVPPETATVFTIPFGSVEVYVSAAGVNLPGAKVYLFTTDGSYLDRSVLTDGTGVATFSLPAENFKFRVDYQGLQYWTNVVTVTENGTSRIDVEAGP